MKPRQKDYIPLAIALFAAILLSIISDKYFFSSPSSGTYVDVVPLIHTGFPNPPSQYFNSQAIDPTQLINISQNNSQQPFNNASQ
jgi:hypothetical protein